MAEMNEHLLPRDEESGTGSHVELKDDREAEAESMANIEEALLRDADPEKGLSFEDVENRLKEWGPNEIEEDEVNPFLKFLSYFTGPMPIMIWIAIIIELVKQIIVQDGLEDMIVLLVLQAVNGTVGYIEERNAGNAIAALKEKLKPMCRVIRHSPTTREPVYETIKARELVPGDVVELKLGDVVPADCLLLGNPENPMHQLQVDESALTGESLPKTVHAHGKVMMSASIKMGERRAVVVATGKNTYFGKAAELMKIDDVQGRFQKILFKITLALLFLSLVLCAVIFFVLVFAVKSNQSTGGVVLQALSVVIVLLVASIPIAMQVVCTSTMAVGSRRLAAKKVIVARLSAIEELAGMTVVCSDKTGTLTKNKLTINPPTLFGDMKEEELIFFAALAANRTTRDLDAIDQVIVDAVPAAKPGDPSDAYTRDKLGTFFKTLDDKFIPFNPVIKRTESTVQARDGEFFKVCKGAPQVVLNMALENPRTDPTLRERVTAAIQEMADRGFRSLGVATARIAHEDDEPQWEFQGLLSLYDPPRDDTKETIRKAMAGGVEVKMITGDQKAIAVETCRRLEMGTKIFTTDTLDDPTVSPDVITDAIVESNGFAEVMPEHKFNIVQALRQRGFVVGMTGDGVNDAPALKRADIGIAVEGATDAAKAAADIVLTEPGLSVIIDAILRSRKIFQRMRNYAIYRIACTLQLLVFFFIAVIAVRPRSIYDDNSIPDAFTLPVISLVVITILNDGTIITIAHDKVIPANSPQRWDLWEVTVVATVLGMTACLGSMLLLVFALQANSNDQDTFFGKLLGTPQHHYIDITAVRTIMYLKISLSDFFTVFCARTRGWFWERRPGYALATAFIFATGMSTVLASEWFFKAKTSTETMQPLRENPTAALTVWVYCIIFFIIQDVVKVATYRVLEYLYGDDKDRVEAVARLADLTTAIATDERAAAKFGRTAAHRESAHGPHVTGPQLAEMWDEIRKLREEVARLKGEGSGAGAAGTH